MNQFDMTLNDNTTLNDGQWSDCSALEVQTACTCQQTDTLAEEWTNKHPSFPPKRYPRDMHDKMISGMVCIFMLSIWDRSGKLFALPQQRRCLSGQQSPPVCIPEPAGAPKHSEYDPSYTRSTCYQNSPKTHRPLVGLKREPLALALVRLLKVPLSSDRLQAPARRPYAATGWEWRSL